MRRLASLATIGAASAVIILSLSAAAGAKGPTEATISGPGMDGPTTLDGHAEFGASTAFGDLADRSGFFHALFPAQPDPMTDSAPDRELGPRYTVEYVVPWAEGREYRIIQQLYPFAEGGPVTYVDPAQDGPNQGVRGGWFLASDRLLDTLVELGVPSEAPSAGLPAAAVPLAAAAAIMAVAAATVIARRRFVAAPEPA